VAEVARVLQGSARSHTIGKLDLDSVSSGGFSSDRSHPAQQGAAAAEASTYFRVDPAAGTQPHRRRP
jgi:hypothetical protein